MQPACLNALERSHLRHHEVVTSLLEAARQLVELSARDAPDEDADRATDQALHALSDAVDYLHRSVPRHFRDEEESLFPRLGRRRPERVEALAQLVAEHPTHLALHQRIFAAADDLMEEVRPAPAARLHDAAVELARVYEDHARREDALFAEAADALTDEDLRQIEEEMEARRGRGGGGGGGGNGGRGGGGGGGRDGRAGNGGGGGRGGSGGGGGGGRDGRAGDGGGGGRGGSGGGGGGGGGGGAGGGGAGRGGAGGRG